MLKTQRFCDAVDRIDLFCKKANSGIAIAEINDIITKNEFISELRSRLDIIVVSLPTLEENNISVKSPSPASSSESKTLIIDELQGDDVNYIVTNLNYNRDWLLSLPLTVIIILSSFCVTKLIGNSNNFWSCITIHEEIFAKEFCVLSPVFAEGALCSFSAQGVIKEDVREISRYDKRNFSRYFTNMIGANCLASAHVSKSKGRAFGNELISCSPESIIYIGNHYYNVGSYLTAKKLLENTRNCFDAKLSAIQLLEFDWLLSKIYYKLGLFIKSAKLLISIKDTIESAHGDLVNADFEYDVAIILNNIGVALYCLGYYDDALIFVNDSAKILNETRQFYDYSLILYNLSLLSQAMGDITNALYYIDNACKYAEDPLSKRHSILFSKCRLLYAYLLSEQGVLSMAESIAIESLKLFRDQLDERDSNIFDAHYVNSLIFFKKGELDRAKICAEKALEISKDNGSINKFKKAYLWAVLGEIFFYSDDFNNAQLYLNMALSRDKQLGLFSDNLSKWISSNLFNLNKN